MSESDEGRLVRPHRSGGAGGPCRNDWHLHPNPFGCPDCKEQRQPEPKPNRNLCHYPMCRQVLCMTVDDLAVCGDHVDWAWRIKDPRGERVYEG